MVDRAMSFSISIDSIVMGRWKFTYAPLPLRCLLLLPLNLTPVSMCYATDIAHPLPPYYIYIHVCCCFKFWSTPHNCFSTPYCSCFSILWFYSLTISCWCPSVLERYAPRYCPCYQFLHVYYQFLVVKVFFVMLRLSFPSGICCRWQPCTQYVPSHFLVGDTFAKKCFWLLFEFFRYKHMT